MDPHKSYITTTEMTLSHPTATISQTKELVYRCQARFSWMLKLAIATSIVSITGALYPTPAQAQLRGNLTVEVNGLNNRDGNVCFSMFNGSQGFPSDRQRAVNAECFAISEEPMRVTFENLDFGSYAVAAYHDRNMDTQLNQGLLGIPTEGFAFSNDAPARTGPASYQDAVFILSQQDAIIQMQMRYIRLGDR